MTKILLILTYTIGFYLFIVSITFLFQRSLLYFPSKERVDVSYYSNTGLKEVEFKTSDGLILKSLFKQPVSHENKTMLIFHGNAGHIGHRVDKFMPLADAGYGLLLLEYRGYGGNPGKPNEDGFYKDAKAALNFLTKNNIYPKNTIIYGESLGCGIASKISTEMSFNSTILEAPFTSIADIAQYHYWYLPAKWLVLDRHDVLGIINKIKSPLLVVHGEKDNVINIEFGKKVFDAAPEPKEALYIPNAGHNNLFEFNVYKKLFTFLNKQ